MTKRKLGLALGSGAARGWAHIGVVRALQEQGIEPDVIAGASIGSLVGAAYASGQLDILEDWVRKLRRMDVLRLLDASFGGGGVIQGSRVMSAIGKQLEDRDIESLGIKFAAVATDLDTGREVWLRQGAMLQAVRASSGLPGLFVPVRHERRWLMDGGVVNPVPVSLCHALGADVVIAVNLNAHLPRRRRSVTAAEPEAEEDSSDERELLERLSGLLDTLWPGTRQRAHDPEPSMLEVLAATTDIMQERITRSRMAGEPPELLVCPRVGNIGIMDFHNAAEAIEEGKNSVERTQHDLDYLLKTLR